MTTPNLFKFATSELSQDAFICWLLSWAAKDYKQGNDKQKALNSVATELLSLFFTKAGKVLPESIEKIVVKRQVSNIDILCIINETYCVIIEDKVGSVQHSNQLERYKQFMMNGHEQTFPEDKIVPIYLQTHDQSCYKKVLSSGFFNVNRQDLLSILSNDKNASAIQSDIYTDFIDYLQIIEDAVQSFNNKPIKDWNHHAWIGFFQYLQTIMGNANWGYVANPTGGFMGLWGFTLRLDNIDIYLQLEEDKICFKMSGNSEINRTTARNSLHKLFVEEAPKFDLNVSKPQRFGSGQHMTFAVLNTDIISKENNDPIDLSAVDTLIEKLKRFINHCVDQYQLEQNKL